MGWSKIWDLVLFILDVVRQTPPIVEQPKPEPKPEPELPKYDWSTPEKARHSVRVICDEMGLTLAEKNLICAVIQGESQFKNTAINHNRDKQGNILSTDWGIAQVNSYYHIGTGKKWPTVQYVLDNPDKVIRWMIALYKQGHLDWWIAYKNGSYKAYL